MIRLLLVLDSTTIEFVSDREDVLEYIKRKQSKELDHHIMKELYMHMSNPGCFIMLPCNTFIKYFDSAIMAKIEK